MGADERPTEKATPAPGQSHGSRRAARPGRRRAPSRSPGKSPRTSRPLPRYPKDSIRPASPRGDSKPGDRCALRAHATCPGVTTTNLFGALAGQVVYREARDSQWVSEEEFSLCRRHSPVWHRGPIQPRVYRQSSRCPPIRLPRERDPRVLRSPKRRRDELLPGPGGSSSAQCAATSPTERSLTASA